MVHVSRLLVLATVFVAALVVLARLARADAPPGPRTETRAVKVPAILPEQLEFFWHRRPGRL